MQRTQACFYDLSQLLHRDYFTEDKPSPTNTRCRCIVELGPSGAPMTNVAIAVASWHVGLLAA